nr:MAG TPA: helix-turn-helix domain protein [Caudoviricetes sp.]
MNTRIKELRNQLNLTQKEFGNQIGLKPTSICDIEQNRCNVTERCIIAICSRFNVNEEWLRFGTGQMFNSIDKSYNDFFEIFKKLNPILQDFLIQTAKNLLDTQSKL